MVKLLIDAGADPNITDIYGQTALHIASDSGENDVANLLRVARFQLSQPKKEQGDRYSTARLRMPTKSVQRSTREKFI